MYAGSRQADDRRKGGLRTTARAEGQFQGAAPKRGRELDGKLMGKWGTAGQKAAQSSFFPTGNGELKSSNDPKMEVQSYNLARVYQGACT